MIKGVWTGKAGCIYACKKTPNSCRETTEATSPLVLAMEAQLFVHIQ